MNPVTFHVRRADAQPVEYKVPVVQPEAERQPAAVVHANAYTAQWFGEHIVKYAAKPVASAAAGAGALSPIALAISLAMEDPDAFGAIAGLGAAAGLAANVANLTGHKNFSTGIMKCLGAFYRGEAMAIGSAPWAARFASLQGATNLAHELGWDPEEAMTMVALMRVAMTVAYTMVVPAAAGTLGVVTSALQEGCARLADAGGTPLMVPKLLHAGKAVHTAFSVGATATLLGGLGAHLLPGERPPGPSEVFEKLVANLPGSPMAVSSGIGFLVWANAMRPHMQESGTWINLSEEIEKTSKAIVEALENDVATTSAARQAANVELQAKTAESATAAGLKLGTVAITAATKGLNEAQAKYDKALAAEAAARSALQHKDDRCAKLSNTFRATIDTLRKEYAATTGGPMTQGVTSPWHFKVEGGFVHQGASLLGTALTSPLTGLAVYSMCEQQLAETSQKEHPDGQAALLVLAYAGFLSYWMGVLFNWVDSRAPKAIAELNATPRAATTEGMRAMLMVVGTLGATYAMDKIFDEGVPGRPDDGHMSLMWAGVIGLASMLLNSVIEMTAGPLDMVHTRASEVTLMAAAASAAGSLNAGPMGALSAAAGVLGGEVVNLFVRRNTDKGGTVQKKGEADLEKFLKVDNATKLKSSVDAYVAELEKLPPQEVAAQMKIFADKLAKGQRLSLDKVEVVLHVGAGAPDFQGEKVQRQALAREARENKDEGGAGGEGEGDAFLGRAAD